MHPELSRASLSIVYILVNHIPSTLNKNYKLHPFSLFVLNSRSEYSDFHDVKTNDPYYDRDPYYGEPGSRAARVAQNLVDDGVVNLVYTEPIVVDAGGAAGMK